MGISKLYYEKQQTKILKIYLFIYILLIIGTYWKSKTWL